MKQKMSQSLRQKQEKIAGPKDSKLYSARMKREKFLDKLARQQMIRDPANKRMHQ